MSDSQRYLDTAFGGEGVFCKSDLQIYAAETMIEFVRIQHFSRYLCHFYEIKI